MNMLGKQRNSDTFLVAITFAMLASIFWGPSWLPFVTIALSASWLSTATTTNQKMIATSALAGLLMLGIANFSWQVGKELAQADDARGRCNR